MELMDKVVATMGNMSELAKQQGEVMKLLSEKVMELENRADTLWEALQGMAKALDGYQKELDLWLKK